MYRAYATRWQENAVRMAEDLSEPGLKVTESAVRNWINGEREPRMKYLRRLATVLHSSVDDLIFPPVGIYFNGKQRLPGDPTYERLVAAMKAVDPSLDD
jgi:transcriptional regulator with XRE-family HTH domain